MNATAQTFTDVTPGGDSNPAADQTRIWNRYAKEGQGSCIENHLVERYLPLVKTVVGRLAMTLPAHVDIDDLYSAGLVGLLNAIRRFNPLTGAAFETYARVRIRGAVFDELRRLDWVPRSVHEKARRVQEAMQQVEQKTGSAPTDAQVAAVLRISIPEYEELLEQIKPATFVCLDSIKPTESEEGTSHYERVPDERQSDPSESTSRRELSRLIADRLEELPEMQRKVLALYYFEDLRLREIAEVFGVTESRICQIHSQAILAIRSYLRRHESPPE